MQTPQILINRVNLSHYQNYACSDAIIHIQKSDRNLINLINQSHDQFSIPISNPNSLLLILVISKIRQINRKVKPLQLRDFKIFHTVCDKSPAKEIINIPNQAYRLKNRGQMRKILETYIVCQQRQSNASNDRLEKAINQYPFLQIVLVILLREYAIQFFFSNQDSYNENICENEVSLLSDYQSNLRGTALQILIDSLDQNLKIIHPNGIKQEYGKGNTFQIIIEIKREQKLFYLWKYKERDHPPLTNSAFTLPLKQINTMFQLNLPQNQTLNISNCSTSRKQTSERKYKRVKRNSAKFNERCKICTKASRFCYCKSSLKESLTLEPLNYATKINLSLSPFAKFENVSLTRQEVKLKGKQNFIR